MHTPDALFIIAKRKAAGPDMVSTSGPSFLDVKKEILAAGPDQGADAPCPAGMEAHHPHPPEPIRPGEGTECPVCRTRTIVEFWVDDTSWNESELPPSTCVDCFNQYGPDGAEVKGVYLRGSLTRFEAEDGAKEDHQGGVTE